jgi:hypothetical protein
MTYAVPRRVVLFAGQAFCGVEVFECLDHDVTVQQCLNHEIGVQFLTCCVELMNPAPCIGQAADGNYTFTDSTSGADYSLATEITFDVWEDIESWSDNLISKSLTGGTIIVPNSTSFVLSIAAAESQAMTPGVKYCEAWAIISGDRVCIGNGPFTVVNTRKFD